MVMLQTIEENALAQPVPLQPQPRPNAQKVTPRITGESVLALLALHQHQPQLNVQRDTQKITEGNVLVQPVPHLLRIRQPRYRLHVQHQLPHQQQNMHRQRHHCPLLLPSCIQMGHNQTGLAL